jgi:chemotaxis protein MotB
MRLGDSAEADLAAIESALATARSRLRSETHSRRHGGAWKVAYADFVTALMALFIVLWLVNSGDNVKRSVTGYFRDPRGYTQTLGAGPGGSGEGLRVNRDTAHDLQRHVEEALKRMPGLEALRQNVQFSVTGEGLRIDLMESEQGTFFVSGQPTPTEAGRSLIQVLATELERMHNPVIIEGHTDSRPFRNSAPTAGYGNWELSVDRANAARRLLHEYGIPPEQVTEIRGYADRHLLAGAQPDDARNRRISMVVRFRPE